MGKDKKDSYDLKEFLDSREKTKVCMDPADYVNEKVPIYASNVNYRRQIAELRDGLIPVQRRILFVLYKNRLFKGNVAKSTAIIGDTMKHYHPHGDSSIYNSIVLMAQTFRNNVTFIKGIGNFANAADDDCAASPRYTNCTMSDFAYDCYFSDWKLTNEDTDTTVDWIKNFDDSEWEPLYLPSKYPVFLLLWRRQMGVGAYIGTIGFSVTDAFNATIKLLNDPKADFEMYPEDPEGCDLVNAKDFAHVLDSNDVSAKMRATYEIVHVNGHDRIEVKSSPFEVNPQKIFDIIKRLENDGKLPEIQDLGLSPENFGKEFILTIDIRKGYDPISVMNTIFKLTQLENVYGLQYQFITGIDSLNPYTLRSAILKWIEMRRETIKRVYKTRLIKDIERILFLEPLIKVIESGEIDAFIKIVRSNNKNDAIELISKKWNLYDTQAKRIIGVRISDLSKDSLPVYKKELKELFEDRDYLKDIVDHHHKIDQVIERELREGIEKYGTKRKTKIKQSIGVMGSAPDTVHYLIFTDKYIKKLPYDQKNYKLGKLEGHALKVMKVNNRDTILIFTRDGRCTPVKVDDIPNANAQGVGVTYTQCKCFDNWFINAINISEKITDVTYVVTITEKGNITKIPLDMFTDKIRSFSYMKLAKDDEIADVKLYTDDQSIMVYTKNGRAAVYSLDDTEPLKSFNGKGVIGSKPNDDDKIIGLSIINPGDDEFVTLTEDGFMKRVKYNDLPRTRRNGALREVYSGASHLVCIESFGKDSSLVVYTSLGMWMLDPTNIKARDRLGKSQQVVNLDQKDYAFDVIRTV